MAFHMREQPLEFMELCPGTAQEPAESLWATLCRQTNTSAPVARIIRSAFWYSQPLTLEGKSGAQKTYTQKRSTQVGST